MVAMMNLGHSPVARWGTSLLELTLDAKVLDCGCGGGANIKRLLKKCPEGIVKGIDYSPVSVEKSKKVNEVAIAGGRCAVLQGSVADMIFAGDWFDAVTAFETVYFWPDLPQCFREVYRVLKPGGTLLICNESNGDTDKDKKWTEIIGGMTIYKDAELKTYLEHGGLSRCADTQKEKLALHYGAEMRGLNYEYLCIYLTQRIQSSRREKGRSPCRRMHCERKLKSRTSIVAFLRPPTTKHIMRRSQ